MSDTDSEESPETSAGVGVPGPYAEAVEAYLDAADWLTPLEGPLKVHARSIAKSLDAQLARTGEVQSALASSFDKVLVRLEARRPGPTPPPTDPLSPSADGTGSLLSFLSD